MAGDIESGGSRARQYAGRQVKVSVRGKGVKVESWRHDNVGRLMNNAVRRFEARVIDLVRQAGYRDTRASHFSLTRNLDRSGTRLTELARRSVMTKQAMSELVDQCVALGLVERKRDPKDGRAYILTFTERGLDWLESCRKAIVLAEHEMTEEIGSRQLNIVKNALSQYGLSYERLEQNA